MPVALCWWA